MNKQKKQRIRTARREHRVRGRIRDESLRPRLTVFRSNANIYAQLVDDRAGATKCSASTAEKEFKDYGGNAKAAAEVGKRIAERVKALGITDVVFDRGAYKYHGRVKALADAAREAGLKF